MILPQITKFVLNNEDLTSKVQELNTLDQGVTFQYNIILADYYILRPLPRNTQVILEIDNEPIDISKLEIELRSNIYNTVITIIINK